MLPFSMSSFVNLTLSMVSLLPDFPHPVCLSRAWKFPTSAWNVVVYNVLVLIAQWNLRFLNQVFHFVGYLRCCSKLMLYCDSVECSYDIWYVGKDTIPLITFLLSPVILLLVFFLSFLSLFFSHISCPRRRPPHCVFLLLNMGIAKGPYPIFKSLDHSSLCWPTVVGLCFDGDNWICLFVWTLSSFSFCWC